MESPLPSKAPEDGKVDDTIVKLGSESQFELAAGVKKLELHYYWVQPKEDEGLLGADPGAPAEFVIRDEHEEGAGIPQAIRIDLTMIDPNADKGETKFSTFAVMHGPTTKLTETSVDAEAVVPQ